MEYSFNVKMDRSNMAFAYRHEINASYKDLGAVCDAVRYLRAGAALKLTEKIAKMELPVPYRRHNKHMGSRSELHGRRGAYPVKAAKEVKIAIQNAIANAANNALDGEDMVIVHACANKTHIERRSPSKGSIVWGRGMYGRSAMMHSDIEYAKIEIALAQPDDAGLTKNMKYFISRKGSLERILQHMEKRAPQSSDKAKGKALNKGQNKAEGKRTGGNTSKKEDKAPQQRKSIGTSAETQAETQKNIEKAKPAPNDNNKIDSTSKT